MAKASRLRYVGGMSEQPRDPPGTGFVVAGWFGVVIGAGLAAYSFGADIEYGRQARDMVIMAWGGTILTIIGAMMAMTGHLIRALSRR